VMDEDNVIEGDTAVPIVRPVREEVCETYIQDEQENNCLEICFLCYSLFDAVNRSPEQRNPLYSELTFDRPKGFRANTKSEWQVALTKIINHLRT